MKFTVATTIAITSSSSLVRVLVARAWQWSTQSVTMTLGHFSFTSAMNLDRFPITAGTPSVHNNPSFAHSMPFSSIKWFTIFSLGWEIGERALARRVGFRKMAITQVSELIKESGNAWVVDRQQIRGDDLLTHLIAIRV